MKALAKNKSIVFLFAFLLDILAWKEGYLANYEKFIYYLSLGSFLFIIFYNIEIVKNKTIEKRHLAIFGISNFKQLIFRLNYFYFNLRYIIIIPIFYIIIFFYPNLTYTHKILFFTSAIFQSIICILFFSILKDYLEAKNLLKHILIIPSIFFLFTSYIESRGGNILLLMNPLQVGCAIYGLFNFEAFIFNFIAIIASFLMLFIFLIITNNFINKNWIS